mmetsp:Transcript_68959/g.183078  ORF Transcript_68959/g.183078 Transcript_68959/m.183078 type:complete len:290 (-) Transcript_68959:45-914(-)
MSIRSKSSSPHQPSSYVEVCPCWVVVTSISLSSSSSIMLSIVSVKAISVIVSRRPSGFVRASATVMTSPRFPWEVMLSELLVPTIDQFINWLPSLSSIAIPDVKTPPELLPVTDMVIITPASVSLGSQICASTEASQSVSRRTPLAAVKSTPASSWKKGVDRSEVRTWSWKVARSPAASTVSSRTPPMASGACPLSIRTAALPRSTSEPAEASSVSEASMVRSWPSGSQTSMSKVVAVPDVADTTSHLTSLSPSSLISPADEFLARSSVKEMSTSRMGLDPLSTVRSTD